MSCGVGHRHSSDLALLWLWCRPAATTPIQPLSWELPYATGVALKDKKKKKKKKPKLVSEQDGINSFLPRPPFLITLKNSGQTQENFERWHEEVARLRT